MSVEELVQLVRSPPMYGSYYLVKKPKGWRLMLRTFGGPDVDWDHVAHLDNDSLDVLQRMGVPTWA